MANGFDLTTARLFLAVAEEGSIAGASRRANITASAVSRRIAELEQHFGVNLLYRHAGGVELTPAGSTMLRRVRNLLNEARALESEMSKSAQSVEGHVTLAGIESAIVTYIPELLKDFLSVHPGIYINLDEQISPYVVQAVRKGTADIGIFAGDIRIDGLNVRSIYQDSVVLVTERDHPLTKLPRVSLEDLLDYEFIGQDPRVGLHALERKAAELGRQIKRRVNVDGLDAACRLSEAGLGIAVLAERSAQLYSRAVNVAVLPLSESWARREIRLCVREGDDALSPAARLLYQAMLDWEKF